MVNRSRDEGWRSPARKDARKRALLAKLLKGIEDPEVRAAIERNFWMSPDERESMRADRVARNQRDVMPVLADLRGVGVTAESLAELRRRKGYWEAIPVLLKWLPRTTNNDIKEEIVRCLTLPRLTGIATKTVLSEFDKAPDDPSLRWAIGNAMIALADESVAEDILRIVSDARNGASRQMFVLAMVRLNHPEAIPLLRRLLFDPDVAGHAVEALGALRAREARSDLKSMVGHPTPWIRRAVRKALKKIDQGID